MSRETQRWTWQVTDRFGRTQPGGSARTKAPSTLDGQIDRKKRLVEIYLGSEIVAIVTAGNLVYTNASTGLPGFQVDGEGAHGLVIVNGYASRLGISSSIHVLAVKARKTGEVEATAILNAARRSRPGRPARVSARITAM